MNISLPNELESYVQSKVKSGLYTSASEVVRESLRIMITNESVQQHQIDRLNRDIEAGLEQLTSGKKQLATDAYNELLEKINKLSNE